MARSRVLVHDTRFHAKMIEMANKPWTTCCSTGYSLLALRKVGESLSVDRIDSSKGYVPGNIQIMALSLNKGKGEGQMVPRAVMNVLLRKLQKVKHDRFSKAQAETIQE